MLTEIRLVVHHEAATTVRLITKKRKRARTKGEMMDNVRRHLHRRQRQPDVIQRFFYERHVAYAA